MQSKIWNKNFIIVFVVNVLTAFSYHILSPTLPKYVISLGHKSDIAGVVATLFTITAILTRPVIGELLDSKEKRKNYLMLSLAIIAVSIFGYAYSSNIRLIMMFRLLHGIGWGITTTASCTIAAASLPDDKLGRGIGIFGIASSFANVIAPNLGLQLVESIGYYYMFLTAFALAALGSVLSLVINEKRYFNNKKADSSKRKIQLKNFIAKEAVFPAAIMMVSAVSMISIISFVAIYTEKIGVKGIGYYFSVAAAVMLISRPLFGRIADRVRIDRILIFNLIGFSMVFVLFYFAQNLVWFILAAIFYGVCFGGMQPMLQIWCNKAVDSDRRGSANGTFYTFMDIGTGIGSTLAGVLATRLGYANMYLCMIIPPFLGILMLLCRKRIMKNKDEKQ